MWGHGAAYGQAWYQHGRGMFRSTVWASVKRVVPWQTCALTLTLTLRWLVPWWTCALTLTLTLTLTIRWLVPWWTCAKPQERGFSRVKLASPIGIPN